MIAAIRRFMRLENVGPPPRRGYDAFVSYSRSATEPLASGLERGLRDIARPWYQVGGLRVFRDRTGLGATPDLATTLFKHIRASNYLVLIASKGAAASPWVEQELRHWFEVLKRPADKAVVVLSDGDLPRWDSMRGEFDRATTGSLPPIYLQNCHNEPAFVDLRWIDATKPLPTLKDAKFLDQIADVATPLLGKDSKDEVISDEMKRRKNVRSVIAASVLLVVALAGGIYWLHDKQVHIARSEAWAKRAGELTRNNPDQALLFALAAADAYPTDNAGRALMSATFRSAGLLGIARGHTKPISALQFIGPSTLISADEKGSVREWKANLQAGVAESRPMLSLGFAFPKDESIDRVPGVRTTVVIEPTGQWLLVVNSAEGPEDSISESRAAFIALASAAPPLPPDLAKSFRYLRDTIDVSPDGQRLTLFSGTDQVRHWTVGSASAAEAVTTTENCFDERATSRDASTAVCKGFVDDPMPIWDVAASRIIGKIPMAESESVSVMAVSDDGAVLAKAALGTLRVVPLHSQASFKAQSVTFAGNISALAFGPSGKLLAVSLDTGRLLVLGLVGDALERVATFDLGDNSTTRLAISPDDLMVAAGARSGAIEIWSLGHGPAPLLDLTGPRNPAGLAVSSDEDRVAIASSDAGVTRVIIRKLRTGEPIGKSEEFDLPILGLGFVGDRLRVIGEGARGEPCPSIGSLSTMLVATVDVAGGPRTEVSASATRCDLTGAQLAPKGVITAAENGIALWREDTGSWQEIWNQPQRLYTNPVLTASADGTRVAFVPLRPWDTNPAVMVQVWSLLEGVPRLLSSLDQTTSQLSIFLSADGSVLGVRTDARIDLWRIEPKGSATSLGAVDVGMDYGPAALDRDGSRLAVARENGAIDLWDTRGPFLAASVPAPAAHAPIAQLVFPGRHLLVVEQNGATRRLDTQPEAWVQRACSLTSQLRASGRAAKLLGEPISPRVCATTAQ